MSTRAVLGGIRTLAAIAFATGIVLFGYVGIQQAHRTMANDPQIEIAEDAAAALRQGAAPAAVVPVRPVPLETSLAPFVIVVDRGNHPLAGNASLEGRIPVPPPGVLALARRNGEHTVTWQPRPGVRSATVLAAGPDGMVVIAGRSLREVEHREQRLRVLALLTWLGAVTTSIVWSGLGSVRSEPRV
jgi:hypothetical protein